MTSNRWEEINRLYNAAVEVEEKERAAFLEKACGEDTELRREVESLLAYDQLAQQFLDRPQVGSFRKMFGQNFDGHSSIQPRISGGEHFSHAASAQYT